MQITLAPALHLPPSALVDAVAACPICHSDSPRRPVFRLQSDPDVHMLACGNCHGCSASLMPSATVLTEYYARYYGERDHHVTFADPERFASHFLALLGENALPPHVRILDYGGGDGSLSHAIVRKLLERGVIERAQILVVDYSTRSVPTDDRIVIVRQLPDVAIEGCYDLVLASAILEHIPDLGVLIPKLYAAISPQGFFYARTPYAIPLTKLFARLDLTYPAHVHDLGICFWNRFCETFGWAAEMLVSGPSAAASSIRRDPLRGLVARLMKLPAYLESLLSRRDRKGRFWHLVGGWEVLMRRVRTESS